MHNFLVMHKYWESVVRGVIRGVRRHNTYRQTEKILEELYPGDDAPENDPDRIAWERATDAILGRIESGNPRYVYMSREEALQITIDEIRFQRIAIREDS